MRTPLTAIAGWVGVLRIRGGNGADLAQGLDVIERNARAQVQLIEDVLDVSRIVSGKLRMETRPADLVAIITAGADVMRPAAEAKGIALEMLLDPAAATATCDPARIQQVVWNLVSNAVKFTHKAGTIRVTLERENSSHRITVSDDGRGIDSDLLPYVFDRFRQAEGGTRRKFGGLGLGLSIVKHLVDAHGGGVTAESAGEGHGSTFTVRLPIKAVRVNDPRASGAGNADDDPAVMADAPLVRLDGVRVLVVDDEADARQLLGVVLESVGAVVIPTGSVAEALTALAEAFGQGTPSDVLLSDLGMPDRDGYDLIREVRRLGHHARDLPAVALTAFAHKEDARAALLSGFQVHLSKPISL